MMCRHYQIWVVLLIGWMKFPTRYIQSISLEGGPNRNKGLIWERMCVCVCVGGGGGGLFHLETTMVSVLQELKYKLENLRYKIF